MADKEEMTTATSTSTGKLCEHPGFYHTIRFWIFTREGIACEKCAKMIWVNNWHLDL